MIKKRYEYLVFMFGAVFKTMTWYQKLILLLRVSDKDIKRYDQIVKVYKERKGK